MDFYIDLSHLLSGNLRIEHKIWQVSSAVLLILAAINVVVAKDLYTRVVYALMLVCCIAAIFYYRHPRRNGKLYVRSDAQMLEYKLGHVRYAKQQLLWESIAKAKFGPTYIRFFKRTGRRKTLKLGWLPYELVVNIKQQLMSACDERGIAYEVAEFTKG